MVKMDEQELIDLIKNAGDISEEDFVMELELILKDYYNAKFFRKGKTLVMRLFGGQELVISVEGQSKVTH